MLERALQDYSYLVGISFPRGSEKEAKILRDKLVAAVPDELLQGRTQPVFSEYNTAGSNIRTVARQIARESVLIVVLADAEYAIRSGCRAEWKHISSEHERWEKRVFPLCFDSGFDDAGFYRPVERDRFDPPVADIWSRVKEIAASWNPQRLEPVFLSPDNEIPGGYPVPVEAEFESAIRQRPWQEHAIL